jgi:hypothetical protein
MRKVDTPCNRNIFNYYLMIILSESFARSHGVQSQHEKTTLIDI